ncbi:MAG TPA: hypothetical protein VGO86_05675 [Candidatus Dormibacteraeota bacterium]
MRRDEVGRESIGRTILVVEEQPYLWAALRQRVDPALAYVRSAAPGEVARVWRRCRPWPWLLAGATPVLPPELTELIGAHPIPVHWVGQPPAGLPGSPAVHRDWTELVAALERLGGLDLNGVRLLRNRGLHAPDGRIVLDVVNLEGLLAAPAGLVLNGGAGEAIAAEIDASRLPLRLERQGDVLRLVAERDQER